MISGANLIDSKRTEIKDKLARVKACNKITSDEKTKKLKSSEITDNHKVDKDSFAESCKAEGSKEKIGENLFLNKDERCYVKSKHISDEVQKMTVSKESLNKETLSILSNMESCADKLPKNNDVVVRKEKGKKDLLNNFFSVLTLNKNWRQKFILQFIFY